LNNKDKPCRGHAEDLIEDILKKAPPEAPGVIIVDLDILCANWRTLADLVAPAKCAAVVKADAYGLGASHVIPALAQTGCTDFFVATLKEALEARELAQNANIYILDGILPGAAQRIFESGARPVISTLDEAREWAACAANLGADTTLACALHLDTGLNRLGLDARDIRTLAADSHCLARLDVKLVMSHMACADEPDHPMNETQRKVFEGLRPLVPSAPFSLAASDGLMLGPDYHFDMVRPGYALYGGQAFQGAKTPVSPVVKSYARVLQVRDTAPGHAVGYSASYKISRQSRIAVVALGYADGFDRHASRSSKNTTPNPTASSVAFDGKRAPLIGRVSMDLICVDVTDIEDDPIKRGDWAEIIGPNLSIEEIGKAAGTIGYEVLTRLGTRFQRIYLDTRARPTKQEG